MPIDTRARYRSCLIYCLSTIALLATSLSAHAQDEPRSDAWLAILLTWGPVLLIVGLWVYFMRRYFSGVSKNYYQENRERMAGIESHLERIANSLDRLVDEVKKSK